MKLYVCVLSVCLGICSPVWAATHWVSNTGSAAYSACVGASPLNGSSACAVQTAFDNAVAGDLVYFRGGTYVVPQHTVGDTYSGTYVFANSGTGDADANRIIFRAYTSETPILNGTMGGASDGGHCYATILSTSGRDYITIDGFSFIANSGADMARVHLGGVDDTNWSSYITFTHNDMNGGSTLCLDMSGGGADGDNNEGIRVDFADHTVISYNVVHHYRSSRAYTTLGGNEYIGITGSKAYHDTYSLYENNEYHHNTGDIYEKSYGEFGIFRYNYLHDSSICMDMSTNSHYERHGQIYHNICYANTNRGIFLYDGGDDDNSDWNVHNNTIYTTSTLPDSNSDVCVRYTGYILTTGTQFYNNIISCPNSALYGTEVIIGSPVTGMASMDYNNYGAVHTVMCLGTAYSILADIRTATCGGLGSGAHDVHSIGAAPIFVNTSGTLSTVADFALTVASPGYHAGNDGLDMGANVALVGTGTSGGGGGSSSPGQFNLRMQLRSDLYDPSIFEFGADGHVPATRRLLVAGADHAGR